MRAPVDFAAARGWRFTTRRWSGRIIGLKKFTPLRRGEWKWWIFTWLFEAGKRHRGKPIWVIRRVIYSLFPSCGHKCRSSQSIFLHAGLENIAEPTG